MLNLIFIKDIHNLTILPLYVEIGLFMMLLSVLAQGLNGKPLDLSEIWLWIPLWPFVILFGIGVIIFLPIMGLSKFIHYMGIKISACKK